MTAAELLRELQAWRIQGGLGALSLALPRFLHECDADAPASLLAATAVLVHLEAQGHSSLPLNALAHLALPLAPPAAVQALWPVNVEAATAAWGATPLLQIDPLDDTGASPLVLAGGHLYLRRYWRHEAHVAAQVRARSQVVALPDADAPRARALLDELFGAAAPDAALNWQKAACALALLGRFTVITGGPGTGKTYTAARLLVWLQQLLGSAAQPLRVALAAPTGKAASRLGQAIAGALQGLGGAAHARGPLPPALTLHALLGARPGTRRLRFDAAQPLEVDLLIVDEASMVHLEMMSALLDALPPTARLVLLGDPDQLASVEAGAVLGDLCRAAGAGYGADSVRQVQALTGQTLPLLPASSALAQRIVSLRQSRRFSGPIGALAQALNAGDGAAALGLLRQGGEGSLALRLSTDPQAVLPLAVQGYRACLQALAKRPVEADAFAAWAADVLRQFDTFRVLCAVREGPWGVAGVNAAIERALVQAGLLARRGEWFEGRPVMVTRNHPDLGVFNGDIGLVLAAPGSGSLRAWFLEGDALRSVAVARLADVQTAFAMTVHKSQGSEFGHVVLVLPQEDSPVLTRELVYTGVTRARLAFTLVAPHEARLLDAAARMTERLSGLRRQLQDTP